MKIPSKIDDKNHTNSNPSACERICINTLNRAEMTLCETGLVELTEARGGDTSNAPKINTHTQIHWIRKMEKYGKEKLPKIVECWDQMQKKEKIPEKRWQTPALVFTYLYTHIKDQSTWNMCNQFNNSNLCEGIIWIRHRNEIRDAVAERE